MPGFTIKFTNDFPWPSQFAAFATRPTAIYAKLKFFNPPKPPDGDALVLFAHELVHVEQGSSVAWSILGEVMAYQVQSSLRQYLHPGSTDSSAEQDAIMIDLSDPAIHYNYARWFQMLEDLDWWQGQHPNYGKGSVPFLLPAFGGNPFPAPASTPPDPVPRVPTPPPIRAPEGTPAPSGTPAPAGTPPPYLPLLLGPGPV
jgi:hypothetical protein